MRKKKQGEERTVQEILKDIKSGVLDPKTLSKLERQPCVEVLRLEGYQNTTIAALLKTSDRTIRRDVAEIRKRNGLRPNANLVQELVGDLCRQAQNHQMYLMRVSRSSSISASDKIQAEIAAWKVLKEMFGQLNSIGYLQSGEYKGEEENSNNAYGEDSREINPEFKTLVSLLSGPERAVLIQDIRNWMSAHLFKEEEEGDASR